MTVRNSIYFLTLDLKQFDLVISGNDDSDDTESHDDEAEEEMAGNDTLETV